MEAHCFKCPMKREIKNPQQVTMNNGKQAIKSVPENESSPIIHFGSSPLTPITT